MRLYRESEARDRAFLESVWRDDESFALLPDKLPEDGAFLSAYLKALPAELERCCFALLTSGSTGLPKLIVGQKSRAAALARTLHDVQASDEAATAVLALPISYTFAFVNQVVWSLTMQRGLAITPGLADPQALGAALEREPSSMICLVGAQLPLLFAAFGERQFANVIRIHFAGGRFPQERLAEVRRMFPCARIYNNYGCAEAMPRLTCRPAEQYEEGAIVGPPLPGVDIRAGEDHALLFRSPYRAVAMVDEYGLRAIDDAEWLPSGDLTEPLDDGSWRLLGRNNEVFKRFGEKVSLPVLRRVIGEVWRGEAAFYRETDKYGELAHVLVLAPAPEKTQINAILQHLRKSFSRPHWPVRIESLAAMPLSVNNKIDTAAIVADNNRMVQWTLRF